MDERFVEIEHTADVAIRVWGRDLAELYANAAYGLACQLADPAEVEPVEEREVALEAFDAEALLVTWLGELLYLAERDGCVYVEFDVLDLTATHIKAVVRGGKAREHRRHVKAVTFSGLEIVPAGEGYEATVVFDV